MRAWKQELHHILCSPSTFEISEVFMYRMYLPLAYVTQSSSQSFRTANTTASESTVNTKIFYVLLTLHLHNEETFLFSASSRRHAASWLRSIGAEQRTALPWVQPTVPGNLGRLTNSFMRLNSLVFFAWTLRNARHFFNHFLLSFYSCPDSCTSLFTST